MAEPNPIQVSTNTTEQAKSSPSPAAAAGLSDISQSQKRAYDEINSQDTTATNHDSDSDYNDSESTDSTAIPQANFTNSASPSNNVDLMQMMHQIRQQLGGPRQKVDQLNPLVRTSSNSSTISTNSNCSISSANDLNSNTLRNENSLKQFIMSITNNSNAAPTGANINTQNGHQNTDQAKTNQIVAAFADQFAYMVRSRSSSLSDSSSSSSTGSSEMLQNPVTASLMKQMYDSYQASMASGTSCSSSSQNSNQPNSPISKRTSSTASNCSTQSYSSSEISQIGQTSCLMNSCNLESAITAAATTQNYVTKSNMTQPTNDPPVTTTTNSSKTDELLKAKLNAAFVPAKTQSTASQQSSNNNTASCKVCGDESSGFHYGVDSCEGCKGFFRRCITQGMNHQCTNQQQCEITPFSRNSCQFCRLKKCFAVGMSREASRLGRRPKRPKDDKSAPSVTPDVTANNENSVGTPNATPSKQTFDEKPVQSVGKQEAGLQMEAAAFNAVKVKKEQQQQGNSIPQPPFRLNDTPSRDLWSVSKPVVEQHQVKTQQRDQKEQMQQIEMLTKLISISDRHTSIERTNELEFIRTAIIEAHCQIWPTTFEKIRHRYLERPPTRATNNYNRQSNNNHEIIWDTFVDAMVPLIMDVVKYCKYIPGFNQILQHDQVQLLKQGSFEVICVNSFMLVDAQNKLMLTPDMEYLMDSTTIKTMPLGFFMSEVFELGIQVSPLKLSDAEIALFNALLVMNPDRGDLQDKDHVEELQSTMLHVLYKHLKYYRSDEPDLFFKLLKLIPIVQEINRKHSEALNTIKMSQSGAAGTGTKQKQSGFMGHHNTGQMNAQTQQTRNNLITNDVSMNKSD